MTKRPEDILDEYVNRLRKARNFNASSATSAVQTRTWKEVAGVIALALNVPTREAGLDQIRIWSRVATGIGQTESADASAAQIKLRTAFSLPFPKMVFAGVLSIAVLWLVNSTAVAASNSLPGQTLYPVKRTVEKIQLTLTVDSVKKTEVRIKHAENRLVEAKTIIDNHSSTDEKIIEQTLNELKDATAQVGDESGGNTGLLKKVVELADKQEAVLSDIESKVSGEAKLVAGKALDTAAETKTSAEKDLAELEGIAPHTEGNADAKENPDTASSTPATKDKPGSGLPTTTDEAVQTLGAPQATGTEIILKSQNFDHDTSTPEIIELK